MADRNMIGERILITGANSGIGKVTALELATRNAHVVMVSRDMSRGKSAKAEIIKQSGNTNVDLLVANLSSQCSIRKLASEFRNKYDRFDILVNNAGGIFGEYKLTEDGIEWTFAVNHLAYFLLTHLLLDIIKKSSTARIINVASEAHRIAMMDFDNLNKENGYNSLSTYGESKLANILFTYELSRRLKDTHITVNCVHPGVVRTRFGESGSPIFRFLVKISRWIYLSPEKGAETVIYLATSPDVENETGKYFIKEKPVRSSTESYNRELARKLWEVSAKLTNLNQY